MSGPATCDPSTTTCPPATSSQAPTGGLKQQWDLKDPPPLDSGTNEKAKKFTEDFKASMEPVKQCLLYTKVNAEKPKHDEMVSKRDKLYTDFPAKQAGINKDETKADSISKPVLESARKLSTDANNLKQKTENSLKSWQAKEPEYDKAVVQIEELETWGDKMAVDLRKSATEIRTAANDNKYDEAVKRLVQLQTNLKPTYDEYTKQKAAKEKYDPALKLLEPRLPKSSEKQYAKLAPQLKEINDAHTQMVTAATAKDYVKALPVQTDLSNKIDKYVAEQTKIDQQKKAYEDALVPLKPRLTKTSESKFAKLAPKQQSIANAWKKNEETATAGDYEQALKLLTPLTAEVDAYLTALEQLEQKKKAYDDAMAKLQPRLTKIDQSTYKKLAAPRDEIVKMKQGIDPALKAEDFEQAVKRVEELSTKVTAYEKLLEEHEKRKQAYDQARKTLDAKITIATQAKSEQLPNAPKEFAKMLPKIDALAASEDYDQASKSVAEVKAKVDAYLAAIGLKVADDESHAVSHIANIVAHHAAAHGVEKGITKIAPGGIKHIGGGIFWVIVSATAELGCDTKMWLFRCQTCAEAGELKCTEGEARADADRHNKNYPGHSSKAQYSGSDE
jgi:hypothetical protein